MSQQFIAKNVPIAKQINETKGECWGMKDILMAKFFDIKLG